MGLPIYSCSEELAQSLPDMMGPLGIRIESRVYRDHRHAYILRRGLATVQFCGTFDDERGSYGAYLACGRNLLFWFFDMRLLSRVEQILRSHGAAPRGTRKNHG